MLCAACTQRTWTGKFEYIEVYLLAHVSCQESDKHRGWYIVIAYYSFVTASHSKESLGDKANVARKGGKVNT